MTISVRLRAIVSGGQTGVDRAALDVALELGIPCGGWCPKGRRAEDGMIPDRYPLRETGAADYRSRTRRNARDSDGTLILTLGSLDGGTAYTRQMAAEYVKPCLIVDLDAASDPREAVGWLRGQAIRVLNVAGPRESRRPGIHARATEYLYRLFL